jgi:uncharacterized RDD family membrane protein YckC
VICSGCGFSNSPTVNFCLQCKAPLAPQVSDLTQRLNQRHLIRPDATLGSKAHKVDDPRYALSEKALDQGTEASKDEERSLANSSQARNVLDRELVRPNSEGDISPQGKIPPAAPEPHPFIERTLEKLKRAQPVPPPEPAITASTQELPDATPIQTVAPKRSRRVNREAPAVERIEIKLNQPLLPFDSPEASSPSSRLPEVSRGLMAAPIPPRLAAGLIDLSFLLGSFLIFLLLVRFVPDFSFGSRSAWLGLGMAFLLVSLGYLYLFTWFAGKTLGMDQQQLHVIDFHGRFPDSRQAGLRSVGYLISTGCFGLGFLWAVFDAEKLCWHDRISGTLIVATMLPGSH